MSTPADVALAAVERDGRLVALIEKLNRSYTTDIAQLHDELQEVREDMQALSNRLESVTRAQVGSGLHSVKS